MDKEFRRSLMDHYVGWGENWGLTLAFAVTQSTQTAEQILADALVALMSADFKAGNRALAPAYHATRLAAGIWEQSRGKTFRGFSTDPFVRLPAVTRAIVILKARAQFTGEQISETLKVPVEQVEEQLENSRLLFSAGRPWLESSPTVRVVGSSWVPECLIEGFGDSGVDLQGLFARYLGHDLNPNLKQFLQSHLVACEACRKNFMFFKKQHSDWADSLPKIEVDPALRRHLRSISAQTLKIDRRVPSPWPGLRKVLRQKDVRLVLLGVLLMILLHTLFGGR